MAMFFAFCAAKLPAVQGSCHTSLGHGKGPRHANHASLALPGHVARLCWTRTDHEQRVCEPPVPWEVDFFWLDPLDPCHDLGASASLACLPCVNGAASVAAMLPHPGQDRYASTRLLQRCKVVDTLSG